LPKSSATPILVGDVKVVFTKDDRWRFEYLSEAYIPVVICILCNRIAFTTFGPKGQYHCDHDVPIDVKETVHKMNDLAALADKVK